MPFPEEIIRDRVLVPGPSGAPVPADYNDMRNRITALETLAQPIQSSIASGYYYGPVESMTGFTSMSTQVLTLGRMDAGAFRWPASANFSRVEVEIVTAVAGATIRLAVYNSGTDGMPTTKVVDLGTIDASVVGARPGSISGTLARGRYWLTGAASAAGVYMRFVVSNYGVTSTLGHFDVTGAAPRSAVYQTAALASGFTTLPATFGAFTISAYTPAYWLKAT